MDDWVEPLTGQPFFNQKENCFTDETKLMKMILLEKKKENIQTKILNLFF